MFKFYASFILLAVALLSGCSPSTFSAFKDRILGSQSSSASIASQDASTIGFLDFVGNGIAAGWALDRDTPDASIDIHIYIDHVHVGITSANQGRLDVNAALGVSGNHGFVWSIPPQYLNGVSHLIQAYAIDSSMAGPNPQLGSSPTYFQMGNPPPAVAVLAHDYIQKSVPGVKLCQPGTGGAACIQGFRYEPYAGVVSWVMSYTTRENPNPFIISNAVLNPYTGLVGVEKDFNSAGGWRCFADPGIPCGGGTASFAPNSIGAYMELPVLSGSTIRAQAVGPITYTSITPGAKVMPGFETWRIFEARQLDPNSCGPASPTADRIWQKTYAFIADQVDFGGALGVQQNILVIELEQSNQEPGTDWIGAMRLERYYFSPVYGEVRETGTTSDGCRANLNGAECSGNYVLENDTIFNMVEPSSNTMPTLACPFQTGNW